MTPSTGIADDEVISYPAVLNIFTVSIGAGIHEVEIEINTEVTHLTIIVCVGEQSQGLGLLAGLLGIEMVYKPAVLQHILVIDDLVGTSQEMRQVSTCSHKVIVGDLPVDTGIIYQLVVLPRHGVGTGLLKQLGRMCNFLQRAMLLVVHVVVPDAAKDIYSTCSVVQAELGIGGVDIVAQILFVCEDEVDAQTLTLLTLRTNAYHSPYCGVVLCSRVIDDLHVADVLTAQAFQLIHVTQLTAVEIDERRALAQHLRAVLTARHSRHLDEHLRCRTGVGQCRTLNTCNQRISFHTGIG